MKQTPRKLVLDTDALLVETFVVQKDPTEQTGTVQGHMPRPTRNTCPGAASCENTCTCPSWSGAECGTVCIG